MAVRQVSGAELRCPHGKPYVAYLTTGEEPTRLQAEAEGWGHANVQKGGRVAIKVREPRAYRVAVYCCYQNPLFVGGPVPGHAMGTITLQLTR